MSTIKDIKIIGIDPERPPMIRKEAYVDLYFKLSVKAPIEWCEDFNKLGNQLNPSAKIKPAEGLFIETYVRDVTSIQAQLDKLKAKIKACSEEYLAREQRRLVALAAQRGDLEGRTPKQVQLDAIIAGLRYED
jgi:hypothetical protein